MEKKISMEGSQIAMLCTENEQIYMKERSEGEFFQEDNLPTSDRTPSTTKEPEIVPLTNGIYPLHYVMEFLKMAKKNKAAHIKITMGLENRPLRLEFESPDNLNIVSSSAKVEKTWYYLAPRITEDTGSPDEIKKNIETLQKEIDRLKLKLPKEESKAL